MNKLYSFVSFILFANIFYGCCIAALLFETVVVIGITTVNGLFFSAIIAATIVYYSIPYFYLKSSTTNERFDWFLQHKKLVYYQIVICTIIIIVAISCLYKTFGNFQLVQAAIFLLFPFIALLYYSNYFIALPIINIRLWWLLKPCIIGIVWAGVSVFYPIVWHQIHANIQIQINTRSVGFLFIQNTVYISLLCVLFDIKDVVTDKRTQLKTIVNSFGLRATIYAIVFPATMVMAICSAMFIHEHFSTIALLINIMPFVMLLIVAHSMRKRQTIVYYLAVIDGLIIIKALCGIIAKKIM